MALLNAASPFISFKPVNSLSFSKRIPAVHAPQLRAPRVPSLKRGPRPVVKCSSEIARSQFPSDFKFGASTSAFQTESAPTDGGRGSATWDYMIGDQPAVNSLVLYKDDVACLKDIKLDVYRFSISWSRLFPTGKVADGVNEEGVTFYKNLIAELKDNGVEPFVTLFHFDLPTDLQTSYNGFLSSDLIDDFNAYADYCFSTFGDQVKYWTTFNEPLVWCEYGYSTGLTVTNDATTYPYTAAHNLILAHATAVNTYRTTYQTAQGGKIGIPLSVEWYVPYNNTSTDLDAAKRAWDFGVGWFLDPLTFGDYPFNMKSIVRDRLPTFTDAQKELIKGSYDFIGINYYTSSYAEALPISTNDVSTGYTYDIYATITAEKDGVPIGPAAEANNGIYVYPRGILDVLRRLKDTYNDPLIFVTENGYPNLRNDSLTLDEALQDDVRIEFIRDHLNYVLQAIEESVNVQGYFVWSLMDCMEMGSYYTIRYGLNFTEYDNNYARTPKKSATWLKGVLADTTTTTTTAAAAAATTTTTTSGTDDTTTTSTATTTDGSTSTTTSTTST